MAEKFAATFFARHNSEVIDMYSKIALEEHWAVEEDGIAFVVKLSGRAPQYQAELYRNVIDLSEVRLREMDRANIELSVLSLNAPGIQGITRRQDAIDSAIKLNDYIDAVVHTHHDRFRAFACVALQDPDEATSEIRRCVEDLGMVGTMINGFTVEPDGVPVYLDDPRYDDFWAEIARLDVPVYLHPNNPVLQARLPYRGREWLHGAAWAFHPETATHALRLMGSGLFDRHPGLQIILGHMGEMLPFQIWRIDSQLSRRTHGDNLPAKQSFQHYLAENFYITTSGVLDAAPLHTTLMKVGEKRVLFATDWPYEDMIEASMWFDSLELSEQAKQRICRDNAADLLRIHRP